MEYKADELDRILESQRLEIQDLKRKLMAKDDRIQQLQESLQQQLIESSLIYHTEYSPPLSHHGHYGEDGLLNASFGYALHPPTAVHQGQGQQHQTHQMEHGQNQDSIYMINSAFQQVSHHRLADPLNATFATTLEESPDYNHHRQAQALGLSIDQHSSQQQQQQQLQQQQQQQQHQYFQMAEGLPANLHHSQIFDQQHVRQSEHVHLQQQQYYASSDKCNSHPQDPNCAVSGLIGFPPTHALMPRKKASIDGRACQICQCTEPASWRRGDNDLWYCRKYDFDILSSY